MYIHCKRKLVAHTSNISINVTENQLSILTIQQDYQKYLITYHFRTSFEDEALGRVALRTAAGLLTHFKGSGPHRIKAWI